MSSHYFVVDFAGPEMGGEHSTVELYPNPAMTMLSILVLLWCRHSVNGLFLSG